MSSIYGRLPYSGHYIRKRLRLAGPMRSIAGFSIVLLLASLGLYRLGAVQSQALVDLLLLVLLLSTLALLVAVGGLARVWFQGVEGGGKALGALFLASITLAPFCLMGYLAATTPGTNVAYTEGMAPDEIATVIAAAPSVKASALGGLDLNDPPSVLAGRYYSVDAPRVYAAVRTVLNDLGWTVGDVVAGDPNDTGVAQEGGDLGITGAQGVPIPTPRASIDAGAADDPLDSPPSDQYRIGAVARDPVFALPSDVRIRVAQDNGDTYVDLQSQSRSTAIDLGQNRRFIEAFLNDLDAAMAGTEAVDNGG